MDLKSDWDLNSKSEGHAEKELEAKLKLEAKREARREAELDEFISIVIKITFLASSKDWDSEVASLFTQLFSLYIPGRINMSRIYDLIEQIYSCKPKVEFLWLAKLIRNLFYCEKLGSEWNLELSLFTQIIPLVSSIYLDMQQPKPESELVSLIKEIISLFNSKPDSESELVTLVTKLMYLNNTSVESELPSLIAQLASLKPKPELTSLITRIISRFKSLNWEKRPTIIGVRPQFNLTLEQGKFRLMTRQDENLWRTDEEKCSMYDIRFYSFNGKDYFHCECCNGDSHEEEYFEAPDEVKHSLHPKHSLKLGSSYKTRKCYCCDEDLKKIFYYCLACDYAMNIACVSKPPQVLSIDLPKWHEHTLSLFPSHTSLTCNACSLADSSCPFYICPPCDFLIHQSCISLPRVIRICRHPHRISFTPFFEQGDWSCGVCRKKIDNRYGGYSCFNGSCSYTAHSRCATQSNVWDGRDLEGVPEETEEDVEPFVRISDGIIQHFSHQHYLRLEESGSRDYDENKLCQACSTPIYFGNFYSCMQCEFILHEDCANLSRKIYHQIHPHMLTLVAGSNSAVKFSSTCSSCSRFCAGAFVYKCDTEGCRDFKLNMQCATISEPLAYEGHMHPLFLTSKPGERRECLVCGSKYKETFNCIECECDFALCFECATIPKKVRYKHDEHILTLSYEEETRGNLKNWCEVCEENIKPETGYYKCDEYCCVTLHIECLLGNSLYLKPGTSLEYYGTKADVLANNQHMSRPFCYYCKERCLKKLVFKCSEFIFCSNICYEIFTLTFKG